MKILVAEDNIYHQEVIKALMEFWGYEVDIAANGQRAVEMIEINEGYDLCIMDIDMPLMDGFEATKIIRSKMKYLPIIALTGNTTKILNECQEVGMDNYLRKPYDPDELQKKINELTGKHGNGKKIK